MNTTKIIVFGLALASLSLISASGKGRDSSVGEDWIAVWNSHDPDKVASLFTEDAFYEDVTFNMVSRGKGDVRKLAAFFFEAVPDLHMELMRSSLENRRGTIEWIYSGTDKGMYKTGKKFSVRGVSVFDLRDGKISRLLDFYDSAIIMRQLGLLPAEPAK
jgi:steroid delta-isomerase-like uncharacterized protein